MKENKNLCVLYILLMPRLLFHQFWIDFGKKKKRKNEELNQLRLFEPGVWLKEQPKT